MGRFFLVLLSVVSLHELPAFAERGRAAIALNEGRVDEASQLLREQLASNPHDPAAHLLQCRVNYAQELASAAIQECEAAVADAPGDSNSYLWLGRAYGMKASSANPISAFALARRVVAAFERAVQLDGANTAALRDLGEYYVAAPGIVGGGVDKAQQLATRMMPVTPAKAHRLLAQIAEKNGDAAVAETEFKRAIDAQRSAESYIDLAQFFHDRKQYDACAAAVQIAMRMDRPRDFSAVDAASMLIAMNRSTPLAEQLLREYLASPAKSDGAPAFKVHVQLGDLLLKRGDMAGAKQEYYAALALVSNYAPARKAVQNVEANR